MTRPARYDNRSWGRQFHGWALAAVAVVAFVLWPILGLLAVRDCLLGGLICVLPGGLMAELLFAHKGARQARKMVSAFYLGEVGKLLLTAGLFLLVWRLAAPHAPALLTGFLVAQSAYWWAPWWMNRVTSS